MKTILAPVDFSAATNSIVAEAVMLAKAVKARLVLLHAVQLPLISTDYGLTVDMMHETLSANRAAATRQLDHLEERLEDKGVSVSTVAKDGFPAPNIIDQAKELKADYIVMGSHGHAAIYELIVGSTTHAVLKHAPCPVVIVPTPAAPAKSAQKRAGK